MREVMQGCTIAHFNVWKVYMQFAHAITNLGCIELHAVCICHPAFRTAMYLSTAAALCSKIQGTWSAEAAAAASTESPCTTDPLLRSLHISISNESSLESRSNTCLTSIRTGSSFVQQLAKPVCDFYLEHIA